MNTVAERFAEWWERVGCSIDPDTSDVPWFDKRRGLAEAAWVAAFAQSGNYVADDATEPRKITFSNGRTVEIEDRDPEQPACLYVGRATPDTTKGG